MDSAGKLKTPCLSMSPLHNDEIEDDVLGYSQECTRFRAKEHSSHIIKSVLSKFYGKKVTKNVTHISGVHVSVNIKLATELEKPMIGCSSPRQGLEMNKLIKEKPDIKKVVLTCHKVMKQAQNATVAAELRNLTNLRPKMWNKTRWRGKYITVNQYHKM
jgi:hypothetical protein